MKSLQCVEKISFATAKEFINFLAPSNSFWGNGTDVEWIFRGQADDSWDMLPRSFRDAGLTILKPLKKKAEELLSSPAIEAIFKRSVSKNKIADEKSYRELILQMATEYEATKQFLALADEMSFKLPVKKAVPNAFNFLYHLDEIKFPEFQHDFAFGLAQHHGIPTRYIDWTRKAKIAAYFASAIPAGHIPKNIVVWALSLEFLANKEIKHDLLRILCPQETNLFLHRQDGLFLTYADNEKYYLKNGQFPTIEEVTEKAYLAHKLAYKPLKKITLPYSEVSNLQDILWRERISLAHLMPTEDNFVAELKSLWNRARHLTIHVTAYGDEYYDL